LNRLAERQTNGRTDGQTDRHSDDKCRASIRCAVQILTVISIWGYMVKVSN